MVAATGSGTSASSKKSDAEGKGGTGSKAGAGGSKGPSGGGKMGAKSSQAGGVKKDTKSPAKTSDRTSLSKSPAPSKAKDTSGTGIGGLLSSRFKDPGVAGVPGGIKARDQGILGGRLIDVTGGAKVRGKSQPFAGMKTPALSQAIAFADHLRKQGYGPLNLGSLYRSQQTQNALRAANPAAAAAGRIAKNSQHTSGMAFDATVPGLSNLDLAKQAAAFGGLRQLMGYETKKNPMGSHVHFGVGPGPTQGLGSIAGTRVSDLVAGVPSAPAVAQPKTDPRASINAAPRPKPSNFESEALTRSVLSGLGVNPTRSFAGIPTPTPNMDMGGYRSPMAGLSGMPRALSDPAGGMSFSPGLPGAMPGPSMDMGGYQSPMASVGGLPGAVSSPGKMQDRIAPEQAPAPRPSLMGPGLMASPNVNLDRFRAPPSNFPGRPEMPGSFPAAQQPNMDMSGYNSPMAFDASRMPRALSNPAGGMSFNPGMPGMMPGPSRSRSPFVREEAPQVAQNRERALGLENYQGQPPAPAPQERSLFAGFGETVKKAVQAPITKATDLANTVWDNLSNPLLGAVRPPGPNNPTSRGGQGGVDKPPIQWTGQEPPQMVAEMQQHVEDVLRSILAPQTQYPQYTMS
jgi:hypothetical protein